MSGHIVVIDDCRITLALIEDFLGGAGFRVSTSTCPVYSNHLIYGPQRPDLILLDVMMPLMRGDKKARALKMRDKSASIPVLLMSTRAENELRSLTAAAGADGYLTKPFNAERLLQRIRAALPGRG